MTAQARSWLGLAAVVLAASMLVAGVDLALSAVVPPPGYPEAEDGLDDLQRGDPTVLVLGSSHLRSFEFVAGELARRTHGAQRLVAVPVDWGKASSYRWTWENRLRPLVDQADPAGNRVRPSLRRVILVTQWWDFRRLGPDDDPLVNLPARAWTFTDWLADVARDGVTPYNQNYVVHRWSRLFPFSALVQYRGRTAILDWLKGRASPERAAEALKARYRERLAGFRTYVERGADRLFDDADVAAFHAMVSDWQARGIEVTVLLFPRMHGMITDRARLAPIGRFSAWMAGQCRALGVPLIDLSWEHPLEDADFGQDLDHPTDEANRRLAAWLLDGPMRFLVEGGEAAAGGIAPGGTP